MKTSAIGTMWLEQFRQSLNRSLQRLEDWVRGLEFLPARLRRSPIPQEGLLVGQEFGEYETNPLLDPIPDDWHTDLSYGFRSLHCHVRISIQEPTPGIKFVYRMLQKSYEP